MKIYVEYTVVSQFSTEPITKTAIFNSFEKFVALVCHGNLYENMDIKVYIEPVFARPITLYEGNAHYLAIMPLEGVDVA